MFQMIIMSIVWEDWLREQKESGFWEYMTNSEKWERSDILRTYYWAGLNAADSNIERMMWYKKLYEVAPHIDNRHKDDIIAQRLGRPHEQRSVFEAAAAEDPTGEIEAGISLSLPPYFAADEEYLAVRQYDFAL